MSKSATFQINLQNIAYNYNYIKSNVNHCGAVVKCNAYGFGATKVVEHLINNTDCRSFFVNDINEAIEIFNVSKESDSKIYIMGGFFDYEIEEIWSRNIIPVCFNKEQIMLWSEHCKKCNKNKPISIQIETGLNRLGLDINDFFKMKSILDSIGIDFVMHHLACGYEEYSTNNSQLEKINQIQGCKKSLSSSCGILLEEKHHEGLSRIGRFLYGSNEQSKNIPLKSVGKLTAFIISVKNVLKGEYVGYSQGYQAQKDIKIAIVNIGYGDGYAIRKGFAFTNGSYAPIISCSMDYLTLDVTSINLNDDKVELLGENITFEKIANWNSKIKGMEITCNLGSRVKREYININ
ncbi:alanine racemase [Candidatus Cytomitobacter indipagum]|uniref:alanine racemase n=1 Tax=Candidatus Cytomitobacter indipagum TaxID=2601575 RepID=A0A5C0UDZ2_9PROT|nr:alanine racemase [Candidatus Cytomitobacter indipagum]QEK37901.1 alanine racemase [Candidatus Cytomitobacter indipagum]